MTMITAIDSQRAFDPNGDDVEDDESVSWEDPSLASAEGTEEPSDSSVFTSDSPSTRTALQILPCEDHQNM